MNRNNLKNEKQSQYKQPKVRKILKPASKKSNFYLFFFFFRKEEFK